MKKLVLLMLFVGCHEDPIETRSTDNPHVPVALLFAHEGCKVYRFADGGSYHYFAKCGLEVMVTETHTENCGKNCTHEVVEEVPTVTVKP